MPIYCYKAVGEGCDHCQEGFEQMQPMSAAPLKVCPRCGAAVRKQPTLVSGGVPMLSDANLRDKGFTKFKKKGDGTYEKTT